MQPPICVLGACVSLRLQPGTINSHARAYGLPLRRGGRKEIRMGQRKSYSSDGVRFGAPPRKLGLHRRKEQESLRALGLLHSCAIIHARDKRQQFLPDGRAFEIIKLEPDA